ncbi:hypothetical protein PGTUg99_016445 [Puccinia graminis f. sp. tritici]|uniref:Uncharacterized protein n=1 Tax=Puccinia graminis f. sp. tritici TaxID=56615 RepID=A0A5B0RB59_PUCGR|nr:hypothetical protein PGTUg99_016445 [Puccinia graminis f. sp. tritici]
MHILATLVSLGLVCTLFAGPALSYECSAPNIEARICPECEHRGQRLNTLGTIMPEPKDYRFTCGTLRGKPYDCDKLITAKVYHCNTCNHWAIFLKGRCTAALHNLSQPYFLPNEDFQGGSGGQ